MFEVTMWDGYDEHTLIETPMLTVAAEVAEQERRKGKIVAIYEDWEDIFIEG